MEAVEQQITITMSAQTVTALAQSGFALYGFKAVQCSDKAGVPLAWLQTNNYSVQTQVQWSEQYEAYTSSSPIIPDGQIVAGFSAPIGLGQTLLVDQPGGIGQVIDGGAAGAISIHNTSSQRYTCGISEQNSSTFTPSCAFPLFGGDLQLFAPLDQVLLFFSTQPIETGAVVEVSYGPGILIDLTGAPNNLRNVSYDINLGWSTNPPNQSWARLVPANSQLVPLLIQPSAYLAQQRLDLLSVQGLAGRR